MGLTIFDHEQKPVKHGRMRLSTGVRLHYYTAGTGPAVLLQHGIPKTSYYWRKVLPYLAAHYTCIVPDMRGMGDSTHPDNDYSMATVADDLAELMKELGYDKFHVIGEDWGAAAVYQLAARYRDRVLSLVFQEMLLPGFGLEEWVRSSYVLPGRTADRATFDPSRPETHLWHVSFYSVRDVPELLITGREREYFTWFIKNEAYDPTSIPDDAIEEYVAKASQPGGLRSLFNIYRETVANVQDNKKSAEKKLTLPVLAIGSKDFIGAEVRSQMESVCHKESVTYKELDFGHQLAEECPEQLATLFLNFLGQSS